MFPSTCFYVHFGILHKKMLDGNTKMCINSKNAHKNRMPSLVSTIKPLVSVCLRLRASDLDELSRRNAPEKIYMSKKAEPHSHTYLLHHRHRPMGVQRCLLASAKFSRKFILAWNGFQTNLVFAWLCLTWRHTSSFFILLKVGARNLYKHYKWDSDSKMV